VYILKAKPSKNSNNYFDKIVGTHFALTFDFIAIVCCAQFIWI